MEEQWSPPLLHQLSAGGGPEYGAGRAGSGEQPANDLRALSRVGAASGWGEVVCGHAGQCRGGESRPRERGGGQDRGAAWGEGGVTSGLRASWGGGPDLAAVGGDQGEELGREGCGRGQEDSDGSRGRGGARSKPVQGGEGGWLQRQLEASSCFLCLASVIPPAQRRDRMGRTLGRIRQ